jgi:hypothetical protein
VNLQPLIDRLASCEPQATARAEQLRAQIEDLAARLGEAEQELEHLRITRKTVLALPEEAEAPPAGPADLPEHPDYQRILTVFAVGARRPLRARERNYAGAVQSTAPAPLELARVSPLARP